MEIYYQAPDLAKVKVGDKILRMLAGTIPQELTVTDVTDSLLICGGTYEEKIGWWFDKKTGVEVDEELGWGPHPLWSGSFIKEVLK